MNIQRLGSRLDARRSMERLGVDRGGISIMSKKCSLWFFAIRELATPAANILKQDALSIGAEFALPAVAVTCETPRVDGVLIASTKQLEQLCKKELAQPFGLKEVARMLRRHLGAAEFAPRIMGVINTNDDSFYPQSRHIGEDALLQAERMIREGAEILDVGAVSTRPGSVGISPGEELLRIAPVIDLLYESRVHERALLSIDTTSVEVARYALQHGFGMVNDITGLADSDMAALIGSYGAMAVIMHMQGAPCSMQENPHYEDLFGELDLFFESRLERARNAGIKEVVLDVGIGFGKRLEHNLSLIANLSHFKAFGCPLLVGASRKSLIDSITPAAIHERLPGTLALHLAALDEGASILRCHDVPEHVQALKVWQALGQSAG